MHSATSSLAGPQTGFIARKLIPTVPNFAALELWGAPSNTVARQVISNPSNPAASMTV